MHLEYTGLFIGELRSRENHNVVFPYFLIFLSFCVPCFDTGKRTLEATLKGGSQNSMCGVQGSMYTAASYPHVTNGSQRDLD